MQKKITLIFFIIALLVIHVNATTSCINLRGIKVWFKKRIIKINGYVNLRKGPIELLATTPNGKDHESIFVLNCNPALFHTSLILIGLTPVKNFFQKSSELLAKSKLFIYVQWETDGKKKMVRAEKLIFNQKHNRIMSNTQWIFTGSRIYRKKNGKKIFVANVYGSLITTYYDPDGIVNNPLPDRFDDTAYNANTKLLPPKKTPVTIILCAKEILKE